MPALPRIAFVTIGQTPRVDLVPELLTLIDREVQAVEWGALDGITADEIAGATPGPGDGALVTRLSDGTEAVVAKDWMGKRLSRLLRDLDAEHYEAVVLLCTGHFPGLRPGRHRLIEAQELVDTRVRELASVSEGRAVGIVVPLARQEAEFHELGLEVRAVFAHADPYARAPFESAARQLADCDSSVLHCIGYDSAMQTRLSDLTGRPVLLSRAIVAEAVRELIDRRFDRPTA
jgi:protein AroM